MKLLKIILALECIVVLVGLSLYVLGFFSLPYVFPGLQTPSIESVAGEFTIGHSYPEITFYDRNNNPVQLSEASGKIRIIEFAAVACPASQSFSGAHQFGTYGNHSSQKGLPSFSQIFRRYSDGFSLEEDTGLFEYYRVLVLDGAAKASSQQTLVDWGKHFQIQEPGTVRLLRLDESHSELIAASSIPGFQIIDSRGILIHNLLDRQSQASLYDKVLPSLSKLVEREFEKREEKITEGDYKLREELHKEYQALADRYISSRDYAGLEELLSQLARDRTRTSSLAYEGYIFHQKILGNSTLSKNARSQFSDFVQGWKSRYPRSEHPYLVEADLQMDYAWKARSGGYASTVSEEAFKQFSAHIANMGEALAEAEKRNPDNPLLSILKLEHMRLAPGDARTASVKAFLHTAKTYPYELDAAIAVAVTLLPRWGGSWPEVLSFMNTVDETTNDRWGHAFYAKIAYVLSGFKGHRNKFGEILGADWSKVDQGFELLNERFPREEFNRQQHIAVSRAFGEFERACGLMRETSPRWNAAKRAIWKKRKRYEKFGELCQNAVKELPLHDAISIGDAEKLRQLIAAGSSDLASVDERRKTPLHMAIEAQSIEIVRILLDAGSDLGLKNGYGHDAIMTAVSAGNESIFKLIHSRGGRLDSLDKTKNSLLHRAVARNREAIAISLIDKMPELIDRRNELGNTPLMIAARRSNTRMAKLLLSYGADVSLSNGYARSALHNAAWSGSEKMVNLLIEKGARQTPDSQGRFPKDLAKANGHKKLAEKLENSSLGI